MAWLNWATDQLTHPIPLQTEDTYRRVDYMTIPCDGEQNGGKILYRDFAITSDYEEQISKS